MFVEAVVFLAATIGVLLTISAFIFHVITRQQKDERDPEQFVDAVADSAMEEINKTSQLILNELNEKYQALLFMYQLMDDKQKEMDSWKTSAYLGATEDSGVLLEISEAAKYEYIPEPEADIKTDEVLPVIVPKHPRYGEIKELREQGLFVEEIARRLNMGKGEVGLIIGLSGR